jgi:hypothetical protein
MVKTIFTSLMVYMLNMATSLYTPLNTTKQNFDLKMYTLYSIFFKWNKEDPHLVHERNDLFCFFPRAIYRGKGRGGMI